MRPPFPAWSWRRYLLAERGLNDWTDSLYANERERRHQEWRSVRLMALLPEGPRADFLRSLLIYGNARMEIP